jgi:ligand-binding sensor domain-containing protein
MKKYLFIGVILTGFFVSCSSKKNKKAETVIPKTLGRLITDSLAPPVVTMLTGKNAPKVIKAEKPTSVPLSYPYGVGVPDIANYTIADGLPNNDVYSSAIDQEGNLWFATNGGLSKYDGVHFTNYNTVNGLASDFTSDLFIDSKNKIWITTLDKGISIFDGSFFSNPVLDEKFYNFDFLKISEVLEDKNGIIWLNTVYGLYKYTDEKFTKITMGDTLADKSIASIIKGKNGNLLISTGNEIKSFDGKSFSRYTSIPDIAVKGKFFAGNKKLPIRSGVARLLYCDSKGDIWFTYQSGGLGSYDGKQIKMYPSKEGVFIYRILEDKSGNYWMAGGDGLTKFDRNRFITYNSKDGLPDNNISAITADGEGNIWVSIRGRGICKVSYSYLSGLESPEVKSPYYLTIDRSGNKWIVTRSFLLGKYNAEHIDLYGKELLAGGRREIHRSVADHAGNIWFYLMADKTATSTSELIKFDGNTFTVYGKEQGLFFGKYGIPIWKDNAGNIWTQCNNGFVKIESNSFTVYDAPKDLLKSIQAFFQDTKGQYWFGSYNAGVYKFDGHLFTVYDTRDGIPYNFISDLAEDPMGNIWLATDGGASKFDGKTFTSYRAKDGLDNTVTQVKYDSVNQSLWFTTNLGIASLKIDEIGKKTPFFQHYNQRTGFNLGSSNFLNLKIDNRGVLWLVNFLEGFSSFNYKATREIKPLSIRIKNIKLDNKNVCWNSIRTGTYPAGTKDSLAAINEMALKFGKAFSEEDFSAMTNALEMSTMIALQVQILYLLI